MIARRADTQARADFATWSMMAKLNGASSLSVEAQEFLAKYKAFLGEMNETEATAATIALIAKSYYAKMGGVGTPPAVTPAAHDIPDDSVTDNVTAFRRPKPAPAKVKKPDFRFGGSSTPSGKPKVPVALIFAGLVVVYVGLQFLLK